MENLVKLAAQLLEIKQKEANEKGLIGMPFAVYCAREAATFRRVKYYANEFDRANLPTLLRKQAV